MRRPTEREKREDKIRHLSYFASQRVLSQGVTPRAAVEDVAESGQYDLFEYSQEVREDATAHVEEITVGVLEELADRLADHDLGEAEERGGQT